jgi:hypothetical protein
VSTPYERIKALQQAVEETMAALEPDLPDLPESELEYESDPEDWLYSSERDYLEQLAVYNDRKGKAQ